MDNRHRELLHKERFHLLENLILNEFFFAAQPNVLPLPYRQEIEDVPGHRGKIGKYLDILVRRGPGAFHEFLTALLRTEQSDIADYLGFGDFRLPEGTQLPVQETGGQVESASATPVQLPASTSTVVTQEQGSRSHHNIEALTEDELDDPPIVNGPERIQALIDSRMAYNTKQSAANIRGRVICFSMSSFVNQRTLDSSEADVVELSEYLTDQRLGYDFQVYPNRTADELREILISEAAHPELEDTALLFVIVTSYGNDKAFMDSYGNLMPMKELVEAFDAKKCPAMATKPKAIFVQTRPAPVQHDASTEQMDDEAKRELEHMLLSVGLCPGPLTPGASRDSYIRTLCNVFKRHAHHLNLQDMLGKVAQSVECRPVWSTFRKQLFLCPGD